MKVAALLPSRGLIGSRTLESVWWNLESAGLDGWRCLYSHDRPIPQCFNELALRFMEETDCTHAWFVEEDVVPPRDCLRAMLRMGHPVTFVTYPLKGAPELLCHNFFMGQPLWVGTGCTLVQRRVFESIDFPWFEDGVSIGVRTPGSAFPVPQIVLVEDRSREYGGQDLYFSFRVREAGMAIGIVPDMVCEHPVPNAGAEVARGEEADDFAGYAQQVQEPLAGGGRAD